ncbi:methylated-DNA--[protein]-cysteine S-methyltransferase [Sphingomonas sp. Leaf343]|uniref:methylated-DNA--[protein]-cysteine S-methyltransferase n=1 Tax=Sphingomonas sp. Leaf343 TaxID=1736345 RepID=UPI0007016741|nr:methylated-DNA--[protein]-cysteine S-methyltransferase [Sphingomonas sp. Leaf343]KQR80971.1 cysteine methyltransferase [Sphingomonas sp. Leaf343]
MFDSPVGTLTLVAAGDWLRAITWPDDPPARVRLPPMVARDDHPVLKQAMAQLTEYFGGRRRVFDLPVRPTGTTFQQRVWQELLAIPFGETRSYVEIAGRIGSPMAARAVGAANGRNPISIVIPCHRVVGANGGLTGFAGGIEVKRRLLALEWPSLL